MPDRRRSATIADVLDCAARMPESVRTQGPAGNPIFEVRGKSFVFFRTPRADALDPVTGARLDDVIVFWVPSEDDKRALLDDPRRVFFTTPHFDGHPSVLVRASRLGELDVTELDELIAEAWVARAPRRLARAWLAAEGIQRGGDTT